MTYAQTLLELRYWRGVQGISIREIFNALYSLSIFHRHYFRQRKKSFVERQVTVV
jgi:hypothetical protein